MKSFIAFLALLFAASAFESDPIPIFYDTRFDHFNCTETARKQGACTSSWAHAIASMISERYCIAKKSKISFSAQSLISCANHSKTCDGKFDKVEVEQLLLTKGVVTEQCLKYQENNQAECPAKCENGDEPKWQVCKSIAHLDNEEAIKREILKNGPVVCYGSINADFKDYMSGIYYYASTRKELITEAFKITGWGWENGIFYWAAEAARGNHFGENGWARVKISKNPKVKLVCESAFACELA